MPAQATNLTPFSQTRDGLRLAVRLQPGARKTAIGGLVARADGGVALKAWVTAVPEAGKANAALIALLAKTWRLPKGAFGIASGHGDRDKTLLIAGDPAPLKARLEAWLRDREDGGRR
ncbi:MAG TPA: DUF167 family protein [Kiloniellales bacterium]